MIKAHALVLEAIVILLLMLGSEPAQAQRLRSSTDPVIFYAAPDGTDWVNDCRSQQNPCTFVYRESDSAILVMKVTKDRSGCDDAEVLNRAGEWSIFLSERGIHEGTEFIYFQFGGRSVTAAVGLDRGETGDNQWKNNHLPKICGRDCQ